MSDFKYKLDQKDYLIFQLFTISKSEKIQRKTRNNRIFIPIIYTVFALIFIFLNNFLLASLFVILSILWYIYYPAYQKGRYKRYYTKYINKNFSHQFEKSSNIIIDENHAYLDSKEGKTKIKFEETIQVDEIENYWFLKFTSNTTLIIPKEKIQNSNEFNQIIKNIINSESVKYKNNPDWQLK